MALSQKHPGLMVVPWFNRQEWNHVYQLLRNNNDSSQLKEAHEILQVWKRRTPNLPCGVEGTLILLDVLLFEDNGYCSIILRPAYGMILVRFLNLCCASGEKQGTFSESVKACNIPEWIVNTRHDLAHKHSMPKMSKLKKALQFCFDWVMSNYWEKQDETLVSHYSISCLTAKNLEIAINLYCQINNLNYKQEGWLTMKTLQSAEVSIKNKLDNFATSVNLRLNNNISSVLQQLLQFVRDNEEVVQLNQLKDIVSQTILCFGGFFSMRKKDCSKYENDDLEQLPQDYLEAWKHLIELLYELKLLIHFVKELLEIVNSSLYEAFVRKLASLWIFHIMQRLLLTQLEEDKSMASNKGIFFKRYPLLKRVAPLMSTKKTETAFQEMKTLRLSVVHNPNRYKLTFLSCFLHVCKYPESYIKETVSLMDLVCNPLKTDIDLSYILQAVPQNKELKEEEEDFGIKMSQGNDHMEVEEFTFHNFEPAEDASFFKGCPLGVTRFQTREKNPWTNHEFRL